MGALLDALPQGGSAADVKAREPMLLDYVRNGDVTWDWVPVTVQNDSHVLVMQVQRDGMKLEGVRLAMSARLSQQVADLLGAVMPTPKMCDEIYRAAGRKLPPKPHFQWVQSNSMQTIQHLKDQSALLDDAISEYGGLVADIGKYWVIMNSLVVRPSGSKPAGTFAINYGWHVDANPWQGTHVDPAVTFPEQPGAYVVQSPGSAHSPDEADYSQLQRLVQFACTLDGNPADIRDVMTSTDSAVNSLVSHEGQLKTVRQPGVGPAGSGPGSTQLPQSSGAISSAKSQIVTGALWATGATVAAFAVGRVLSRFFRVA